MCGENGYDKDNGEFTMNARLKSASDWASLICLFICLGVMSIPFTSAIASADTRVAYHFLSSPVGDDMSFSDAGVQIWVDGGSNDGSGPVPTGTGKLVPENAAAIPFAMADVGGMIKVLPKNTVGTHHYDLTWAGDANYLPVSQRFTYQVLAGPQTKTALTSSATGTITQTKSVTFTARTTVSDGTLLAPNYDFYDNGRLAAEFVESFTTRDLTVGTHQITAIYQPHIDGRGYSSSTSNAVTLKVVPLPPFKGSFAVSPSGTVAFGTKITGTATITARSAGAANPTGSVQFYDGSTKIGAAVKLVSQKASYAYPTTLKRGKHVLQAKYLGNASYPAGFTSSATVTIS
jgi:hypothetical protein